MREHFSEGSGRHLMPEQRHQAILPEAQKSAIVGWAYVRRRAQPLWKELDRVSGEIYVLPSSIAMDFDSQFGFVDEVMSGGELSDDRPTSERISASLTTASIYKEAAPNLAALHFAKAAALSQDADLPYDDALSKAKKYLDKARAQGIPCYTPADYLPDAYILRISKKAADAVTLPSPQAVAKHVQEDPSLLEDYALVLPEEQRDQFVEAFPEEKRHEVSVRLDKSVSAVLSWKLVRQDEEIKQQRDAVKARVSEAFARSIEALKPTPGGEEKDFGGRAVGSRWSSKQLTETLVNLDDEDSLQLFRDLALQTTRDMKAANKAKHLKQKSPDEKAEALKPVLAFTGRVLHTLIGVDNKRGGTLTMRYLETTALPDRYFKLFADKLVKEEYFNETLTPFLQDSENIPVLKKLMAQYGTQFNTIVDTLSQIPDYDKDHQLAPRKEELFDALSDLGTLTPRIFARYRGKSPEERKQFAAKIRELKPKFFQNVPIKDILDPEDRDILTEMVYMAYKPNNKMTFTRVAELIGEVGDHTEDLEAYTFPQEGYELSLEVAGKYVVKEGEKADLALLRRYKYIFEGVLVENPQDNQTPFTDALRSYLQPKFDEHDASSAGKDLDTILRELLTLMQRPVGLEIVDDSAYSDANRMAEAAGVTFNDTYSYAVTEYLKDFPHEFNAVVSVLSDVTVQDNIDRRLKKFDHPGVNWEGVDEDNIAVLAWKGENDQPTEQLTAGILQDLIHYEQMEPMKAQLEREITKYTLVHPDKRYAVKADLKAYISKNVGSFFAKAAADICTYEDVALFERSDHFHINVVEGGTVRANNQAYIADVQGEPSLILRGFNPAAAWLERIDPETYAEEIIRVGKQFQTDNGLAGVYITGQDGAYHVLSNRPQIAKYLEAKYVGGENAVPVLFPVSSKHGTKRVYPV